MEQQQRDLSVGQWFLTIFLLAIPLVNFILLLVWGFGSPNPRKNFALALLLYQLIGIGLAVLFFLFLLFIGALSSY